MALGKNKLVIRDKGEIRILKPGKWMYRVIENDTCYYESKLNNSPRYIYPKDIIGKIEENYLIIVNTYFDEDLKERKPRTYNTKLKKWENNIISEDVKLFLKEKNLTLKL